MSWLFVALIAVFCSYLTVVPILLQQTWNMDNHGQLGTGPGARERDWCFISFLHLLLALGS